MTADTHFRQEALSLTSVSSYILTLGLGSQELQISIIDPVRNRCLWLDEYVLTDVTTEEEYLTTVQRLLSQHELMQKTFWKAVRVIVSNQSFTLVPTSLFRKEYAARALSLARGLVTDYESVQHTVHPAWEAVTVFSLPVSWTEWLQEIYPFETIQIVHQVDILLQLSTKITEDGLLLYVEKRAATLVYLQSGRLYYCNRFVYRASADLIYYILFVLNELKVNTEDIQAWAFGAIMEKSEVYQALQPYLAQLTQGLPDSVAIPEVPADQVPSYRMVTFMG
ncbi:DUF3822 family protein [Siphonobacter sp.]|uniref:DUF3822 family protein n=1 Tax=Siphonobacter sp. TaxID=1869184 RepID=UPI003B3A3DE0